MTLRHELEPFASSGDEAFRITDDLFTGIITALRRDRRFADMRLQEFELLMENREKVLPWIKEYSPIELITKDDPPIYLDYPNQKTPPAVGQKEADPTHSAMYGVKLAEKLQSAGVEVVVSYPGHEDQKYGSIAKFLIAKLKP